METALLFALLVAGGGAALFAWKARQLEAREVSEEDLLLRIWKDRARQRACLDDARRSAGRAELAIKSVLDALNATEQHLLAESTEQVAGREVGEPARDAVRASLAEVRETVEMIKAYNKRVLDATASSPDDD